MGSADSASSGECLLNYWLPPPPLTRYNPVVASNFVAADAGAVWGDSLERDIDALLGPKA